MLYKLVIATGNQANVAINSSINGQIIKGQLDDVAAADGAFNIGTPSATTSNGTIPYIIFETDDVVTVTSDTSTVHDIYYQYAYGEIK